ncbi:o-succinylbenzoate--CoA ligase [Vibrio agarivorans]|nr:o-succinylbenzoate--CoA ligase [Vibrio agarivorans]
MLRLDSSCCNEAPWRFWAKHKSDSVAVKVGGQSLTWQALSLKVDDYAYALSQQGIQKRDVILLVGKNQPETLWLYLAAQLMGTIVVLTMPQPFQALQEKCQSIYRADQKRFIWFADDVGSTYSAQQRLLLDAKVLTLPKERGQASSFQSSYQAHCSIQYQLHALASILFTSGSTGSPKAVAHRHSQHFASAQGLLEVIQFGHQDTWLLSLPLYHVSGLAIIYRWLLAGAILKIGLGKLEEDIQGVSHASLVVTQLKRLLVSERTLELTHVLLGGSHIPQELALQAQANGIETWIGYGLTEAASTVTAKQVDQVTTVGRPLAHRKIQLKDQRILIGGKTLAAGYFYQGKLSKLVDREGWFDSKDLGQWQNGELSIIGRADNQFISGGENIHCEEIEAVLNQMEGVIQAIVVPVPDIEFGHRSVAVLQTDTLLSVSQYNQCLEQRLQKFKWPVRYYLMPPEVITSGIKVSRQTVKNWIKTVYPSR